MREAWVPKIRSKDYESSSKRCTAHYEADLDALQGVDVGEGGSLSYWPELHTVL